MRKRMRIAKAILLLVFLYVFIGGVMPNAGSDAKTPIKESSLNSVFYSQQPNFFNSLAINEESNFQNSPLNIFSIKEQDENIEMGGDENLEDITYKSNDSQKISMKGNCKKDSKETNEGPGGDYCSHDDYEECYDYFKKSTVIAYNCDVVPTIKCYEVDRQTDYCKNSDILKEAYLDCAITTLGADIIEWKEKNCDDYDEKSEWVYYCTSNEVRKKKRSYDYRCSDGACSSINSWVDDTLVSKKGNDDYCKKRKEGVEEKWADCTKCNRGDYDCDYDSECISGLECMGPAGGKADGCCKSGETWDTTRYECCECTSGSCCDGCHYKSSSTACDPHIKDSDQYKCEGNCLGNNVLQKYQKQYCSGTSSSCSGEKKDIESTYKNCASSEYCSGSTSWGTTIPTCSKAQCTSGDCCDTTCGNYKFKGSNTKCWEITHYGCPWETNLGNDVGKRLLQSYCIGTSSSCDGDIIYGQWTLKQDCSMTQYCEPPEFPVNEIWCKSIACSSDSNCQNDYWEALKCKNDDVWGKFIDYSCQNPGTKQSQCASSENEKKKEECGSDSCDNWGSNYCKGLDVYRKRTCYEKGCSNEKCFDIQQVQEELVEKCKNGCENGACKQYACSLDSDCDSNIGWRGSPYCAGEADKPLDVWQEGFSEYKCMNPDTSNAICEGDNVWRLRKKEKCKYGCISGSCKPEPPCSNDCSSGQNKCNENYKQTCGNYDADSCLEWGGDSLCNYGCENGNCKPEEKKPVTYLGFEANPQTHLGTIGDSSGKNNYATFYTNDGSKNKATSGITGYALELDGGDDYLTIRKEANLITGTNDFTISGWVNLRDTNTIKNLLAWKNNIGSIQFMATTDDNKIGIWACNKMLMSIPYSYTTNTWYHVAFVRSGNTWKVYINGNQVGSDVSDSCDLGTPILNYHIGSEATSPSQFFNGIIDELVVYDKSLDIDEIRNIYRTCNIFIDNDKDGYSSPLSCLGSKNDCNDNNANINPSVAEVCDGEDNNCNSQIDEGLVNCNPPKKPVLHLDFDANPQTHLGIIGDKSGKGYNANFYTNDGGKNKALRGVKVNALELDGGDDYLTIRKEASLITGTNDFTISAWINLKDLNTIKNLLAWKNNIGSIQFIAATGNSRIGIWACNKMLMSVPYSYTTNTWYHVAFVRNNNVWKVYVNGNQVGSDISDSCDLGNPTLNYHIGSEATAPSQFFNGIIDELVIYDKSLDIDEIRNIYSTTCDILIDNDGDGYSSSLSCLGSKNDCNDNNPNVNPGRAEACDWKDNNCNAQIDEGLATCDNTKNKNILYFDFEANPQTHLGIAGDSSGKGNNATFYTNDGGKNKAVQGITGYALELDGGDDYLTIRKESNLITGANSFTISAWIKLKDTNSIKNILAWRNNIGSIQFFVTDGSGKAGVWACNRRLLSASYSFLVDTWYNVVFIRSGDTWKVFVNGNQAGSGVTESCDLETPILNYHVGSEATAPSQFFNGVIDEFMIFNRDLSETEIIELYGEPLPRAASTAKSNSNNGGSYITSLASTNSKSQDTIKLKSSKKSKSSSIKKVSSVKTAKSNSKISSVKTISRKNNKIKTAIKSAITYLKNNKNSAKNSKTYKSSAKKPAFSVLEILTLTNSPKIFLKELILTNL